MTLHIYVDGSGSPKGKYGYFVEESGKSSLKNDNSITNNEAEYLAILEVLNDEILPSKEEEVIVYSDSQLIVNQINHVYAINNEKLRVLVTRVWKEIANHNIKFEWIPRAKNKAGKMLGS